jgi:hypothetical protein
MEKRLIFLGWAVTDATHGLIVLAIVRSRH